MKNILQKLFIGLTLVIFPACLGESMIDDSIPDCEMKFYIGFADQIINYTDQIHTRITTDPWLKTSFDIGDAIGIFVYKHNPEQESSVELNELYVDNAKMIFDGQAWTLEAPIYYSNDGKVLDIYAYYPYKQGTKALALEYNAAANMTDLLAASAFGIEKTNGQSVPLLFEHLLAMIQLVVIKGDIASGMEDSFAAYFHGDVSGAYNLATKTLSNVADGTAVMTLASAADLNIRVYRAWVPAQQLTQAEAAFSFSQTTSNKEFSLVGEITNSVDLLQGQVYGHQLILQNNIPKDYLYSLYDPYPKYGTPVGMVVDVYNGGKNGRAISLKNGSAQWATILDNTGSTEYEDGISNMMIIQAVPNWQTLYPAFAVCAEIGEGWFLPSLAAAFYHLKTDVNNVNNNLRNIAGSEPVDTWGAYWTSTEVDANSTHRLYVGNGNTDAVEKTAECKIRAIYQF